MSEFIANINQMISLVEDEEILRAIDTLLRACVPVVDINAELSPQEQRMLAEAREGEYESLISD